MGEVVGHPHSGCLPRGQGGSGPKIGGWYNTLMIQSGKSVRSTCNVDESSGKVVEESETVHFKGTDLIISDVSWSHMGRFTCTAQNGFGVDMVSTFLYPLVPAISELSNLV